MKAKSVANALKKAGISIRDYKEGNDFEDGVVILSDIVHIQVSTYGQEVGVVTEAEGGFKFYPSRHSLSALIADVRKAFGFVTA